MDDLTKRVRLDALASCAWDDAVTPSRAAALREMFGGGSAATYQSVESHFGTNAALAWQDAVRARGRFFAAVAGSNHDT